MLCAIDKIAFSIGGVDIAWYGLIIVFGMIVGLAIVCFECKRINLQTEDAIELFLWLIPLAIVFGRLLYVLPRPDEYFPVESWDDFVHLIAVWEGGITIIGGILGGLIGAAIFAYRMRKKCNFGNIVDLIVVPVLAGQIIGRLGNFVNQEAFGIPIYDPRFQHFPFAVYLDDPQGYEHKYAEIVENNTPGWFAATFFYEMVWNFIGACIFFAIWRKNKRFPGILGFCYFFWYFLGRLMLEQVRLDAVPITTVACAVLVPLALVVGAAYVLICMTRQSFRKVTSAAENGTLGITELDRFDVANYKFALRAIARGAFFRWFYGAQDVAVVDLSAEDYIVKQRTPWKIRGKRSAADTCDKVSGATDGSAPSENTEEKR